MAHSGVHRPRPLDELVRVPPLDGILCDIDGTVTWEGRLVPAALEAMARARAAGLWVVPVTGRPAGWVDHIARMWPVDGIVGENGGLWFWMDESSDPPRLMRRFFQPADQRRRNRKRLDTIAAAILAEVPGAALASDQPYRELDLAIDFREDVPPLDDAEVDRIVAAFERHGARARISSIHVNGWFGEFDKLAGFRRFHRDRWGVEADPSHWAYFGDSPNDEPMFQAFPLSIGVANIRRFLPRLAHPPAWITPSPGGYGFVEGVERLLSRA